MMPTGLTIVIAIVTLLMGYAIGGLVEFYKSRKEIDILTRVIEGRRKEDNFLDS